MKKGTMILGILIILGACSFASATQNCDRACLVALMDQYLAAVVKHDPTNLTNSDQHNS